MSSWIKYIFIAIIFVAVTLMVTVTSTRHSTNVTATQEVQLALKSSELGTIRENATNALDKKALVANLVLEVIKAEKEKGNNIKIDYVFLDSGGNVTEDENAIESVQFKVSLLNKDNEVLSTSTQRIALNK